jgi:imidazoleglycerol phosphate dehydratase HisB
MPRTATIHRKTNETEIRVKLNLDGRGKARISTGIRFFDHMLELATRHGGFDLQVMAESRWEKPCRKRWETNAVFFAPGTL